MPRAVVNDMMVKSYLRSLCGYYPDFSDDFRQIYAVLRGDGLSNPRVLKYLDVFKRYIERIQIYLSILHIKLAEMEMAIPSWIKSILRRDFKGLK